MSQLQLTIGQYTSKGRKEINQDFHDVRIPSEPLLSTKGIAIAMQVKFQFLIFWRIIIVLQRHGRSKNLPKE